jgi:predicted anti-sigma-YlaC factor YlaD
MKCHEIRELMPDLAAGLSAATTETEQHLHACAECAGQLEELRQTMALLDEWQAPEPSPYFDVRLGARLREEAAKPQPASWLHWFRKPALAVSLATLMVMGISLFRGDGYVHRTPIADMNVQPEPVQPGTAVGDLQALDKNNDLYSDFDVLDDLAVQPDVTANP